MSIKAFVSMCGLSAASLLMLPVAAQHAGDIALELDASLRIITGSEGAGFFPQRAFGSEFGEGLFNFTDEPGFEAENGVFAPNVLVGFNIRTALGVWNGNGFDTALETLTINFGALERTTGAGFVEGFGLSTNAGGGYHRHFGFTLNGVTPQDSGVFLLELELWSDQPGVLTSLPFWIVFNFNESEAVHDLALDWVNANLVPAPGALLLLGLGLLAPRGCGGRRRRG